MKINPLIASTAIHRYEKVVSQKQAAATTLAAPSDTVEISDRAQLFASLIGAARESELEPSNKIHGIINRLAAGQYTIAIDRVAGKMLGLDRDVPPDDAAGESL
ncbi:MAG: flagellar biosynthesis anti-sigma factor FlgM [Eubacteriales bacterium]|nr:flagellar biosynthesis anti-sigma factor FlgM [Eubacteriales bacterium]